MGLASGVQASSDLALSLRGSVSTHSLNDAVQDAQARNTAAQSTAAGASSGDTTVPHLADPHIALVGRAGVGLSAGQDVHLSSQGTTTVASGQDNGDGVSVLRDGLPEHAGQRFGVKIADPAQLGDGTVPAERSAQDPVRQGKAKIAYQQTGYEHQGSFENHTVQTSTVHAICKIALQAFVWKTQT